MIGILTKKRIVVAKSRCKELKDEYNGLKVNKDEEKTKNRKEDDCISDSYLKGLESDDDDDVLELDNEHNVKLDFDGCSSSTSRVSVNMDKNKSGTSTDNTDAISVN